MGHANSCVIPGIRYHDAHAAIDWLCNTCGFTQQLVVPTDDGLVAHAQLVYGNGMVMLGSNREDHRSRYLRAPFELDGVVTQSTYVVVEDIDAHYARVVAAGGEILMELTEQPFGGKLYTCRDPEGHVWNFGSFDPWDVPDRS